MKKIKTALSVILTVIFVLSAASTALCSEMKLTFNSKGKFKIVVFSDYQDDATPHNEAIEFMERVIASEKPDFVIFTGDNVIERTNLLFSQGVKKMLQPVVDAGVPYAYTYGNHDDQYGITKEYQYSVYSSLGSCFTYDAEPSITGFGNCNIPVYSSDGEDMVFNLWIIDSNTYAAEGYDMVHADQLAWYKEREKQIEQQEGRKIPSFMFQHIALPECYELLKEDENGTMDYNGKRYALELNDKAQGYLGEFPCPPLQNGGQLAALKEAGDVLEVFYGHDHINSYTGTVDGIRLTNVPGLSFESYGDDKVRGCGVIELNENDPAAYTYHTVKCTELQRDICPVCGKEHSSFSVKISCFFLKIKNFFIKLFNGIFA